MIALLFVALLNLRLEAVLEGLRVRATLRNDGAEPVTVVVRDKCAGILFRMIVDNVARSFATGRKCMAPQPVTQTLKPGEIISALSDALDGRMHHVRVGWQALESPMLVVPTLLRIDVSLHATPHARANQAIDVEIAHVNRSPEDVTIPACGEDRLLVDGVEQPLPDPSPCPHVTRTLATRGAVMTRGKLTLPAGRHVLRARWRDQQSEDVTVDVE